MYVGRSGCGKTTLMIDMLKKLPRKSFKIVIISPTATKQQLYEDNQDLFDDYYTVLDDTVIQSLLDQSEITKKRSKKKEVIAVFDDVGEDQYFLKRKSKLTDTVVSARHIPIHLVFLVQKVKQVAPIFRLNTDEAFIFKPSNEDEKKIILNDFLDDVTKEEFAKLCEVAWKKPYDYLRIKRESGGNVNLFFNDDDEPFDLKKIN